MRLRSELPCDRPIVPPCVGLLSSVRGAADVYAQTSSCSVIAQNQYVRDVLFEYYYWNHELPRIKPDVFPSPEAYLEAVRYRPLDVTYSYIANRAEQDAFFSDEPVRRPGHLDAVQRRRRCGCRRCSPTARRRRPG